MRRLTWIATIVLVIGSANLWAQPPGGGRGGPGGPPGAGGAGGQGGPGGQGGSGAQGPRGGQRLGGQEMGRPPANLILDALDPDGDHIISAEEIQAAVAALLKLDKNKDGQLTHEEIHPEQSGPGGRPEGGRGAGGEAGRPGAGREGPLPRDGNGPVAGPGAPEEGGREGRGPGGAMGRGPGGPPPGPEQFVEHAMEFDVDKDGKLSREELMKFANEMPQHGPGGDGPRGPGGAGDGDRPHGGRPGGDRPAGGRPDGDRPVRPGSDQ